MQKYIGWSLEATLTTHDVEADDPETAAKLVADKFFAANPQKTETEIVVLTRLKFKVKKETKNV